MQIFIQIILFPKKFIFIFFLFVVLAMEFTVKTLIYCLLFLLLWYVHIFYNGYFVTDKAYLQIKRINVTNFTESVLQKPFKTIDKVNFKCVLPNIDPWDESAKNHFEFGFDPMKDCKVKDENKPKTILENGVLRMDETARKNGFRCRYQ